MNTQWQKYGLLECTSPLTIHCLGYHGQTDWNVSHDWLVYMFLFLGVHSLWKEQQKILRCHLGQNPSLLRLPWSEYVLHTRHGTVGPPWRTTTGFIRSLKVFESLWKVICHLFSRPSKSVKKKNSTLIFESLWILISSVNLTSQWFPEWLFSLGITS